MSKFAKKIELLTQIAFIIAALVVSAVLVKQYLLPKSDKTTASSEVKVGTQLTIPDVDWGKSRRTLMFVLSKDCRYCTESAAFYQRLVVEKSKDQKIGLIAFFPQNVEVARKYLIDLGVLVDDIRQVNPQLPRVSGTPTLILVDGKGTVQRVWVGKLPSSKEAEVLDELRRQT